MGKLDIPIMLQLGYACINTELREQDIFASRSMIIKTIEKKGLEELKRLALLNIADLKKIIEWNEQNGIRLFRITSALFSHCDNPIILKMFSDYDINFSKDKLVEIGQLAKKYGHRLSMHPGQYANLGSPNQNVVDKTFITLKHHADILVAMGLTREMGSGMIIHGGGTYGDKKQSLERWRQNFKRLDPYIQKYIILENDEWNYGVDDLLPVCEELDIPFCFDIFHNSISKDKVKITMNLMKRIFKTWKYAPPKFHYSNQQEGLRKGSHSQSVSTLPMWIFKVIKRFNIELHIMLEVKDKEQSTIRLLNKYFDKTIDNNGRIQWLLKQKFRNIIIH